MPEICLFGGTTEGRQLAEWLAGQPVRLYACVATEYGENLIPCADNIEIHTGRQDGAAMARLFEEHRFDLVIDATHPFAAMASRNISEACRAAGILYVRLNRDSVQADGGAVYVDTIQDAADFLARHPGKALLTTGSKALAPYGQVADYRERFYVRVLPTPASLAACAEAGFAPGHVIAMQGPFSVDLNAAMLRDIGAKYLVTKESGKNGGFFEKLEAARRVGATCIVIGRPTQTQGLDYAGVVRLLMARYSLQIAPEVTVIGIGMGARSTMTFEADAALRDCDCVIGARRMLEAVADYDKPCCEAFTPDKIVEGMSAHPEYRRFAVVMSGDTGFYSGARKLLARLDGCSVHVIPGLSALQVLCARCKVSWEDVHTLSLHGREGSPVQALKRWGRVFVLTDGTDAVKRICGQLCLAGLGDTRVTVGQRLSYPDERIVQGTADSLREDECAPLSCMLLEHKADLGRFNVGLPDTAFIRGGMERSVPMTKSEIRAISLSKLQLREDAVVYDVGAGTGSVAVEMALNCPRGRVYAIECREDAAALVEENRLKFGLDNVTVVRGTAPEAMVGLPAPTHVFIGGAGGHLTRIVDSLLTSNPAVRMVMNAISLESVGQLTEIMRRFDFAEREIVQVCLSRSEKAGGYHLMKGMNPVYIAALQGPGGKTK